MQQMCFNNTVSVFSHSKIFLALGVMLDPGSSQSEHWSCTHTTRGGCEAGQSNCISCISSYISLQPIILFRFYCDLRFSDSGILAFRY